MNEEQVVAALWATTKETVDALAATMKAECSAEFGQIIGEIAEIFFEQPAPKSHLEMRELNLFAVLIGAKIAAIGHADVMAEMCPGAASQILELTKKFHNESNDFGDLAKFRSDIAALCQ